MGGSGRSGGGSHWPCPSPTHCSCLLTLGPARWSERHSDDLYALGHLCQCLSRDAATNESGNSSGPRAWGAVLISNVKFSQY